MDIEKAKRYAQLSTIFTPGAPVASRDRFAGRLEQVLKVMTGINLPGTQVVMYGERGVGKTSLANVLAELLLPLAGNRKVVRINCGTNDKVQGIWKKVYRELALEAPEAWTYAAPDPDDIRVTLAKVSPPAVIVLDEYDRVEDEDGLSLMADIIKALSDHAVQTKLVIVGVADSIDSLVGEHASIQRALAEVQMPRMSRDELTEIIDQGLQRVDMSIESRARTVVGRLAEGLPFFVHELMLIASQRCVMDDRVTVTIGDVEKAISEATKRHTLMSEYQNAIQSSRPDNLYGQVLVACALADTNALGAFTASAVRAPMSQIMGREVTISTFAQHLNAFTEYDRGPVLTKHGTERNFTYRFRNPMLRSFSILAAIAAGTLPEEFRDALLSD